MKEAKFERNRHTIRNLETGECVQHKSVNKAKKWSHKKQMELDKKLGLGSVRLASK